MTPTEAAALAVLYAFVVGVFVYREIKWRDLPGIMTRSAVVTGTVCFLLAVAAVIAWMLAVAQVPAAILAGMQAISAGPITFLILNAILFILLGAVLEGLPAVVILVPAFLPVVKTDGHRPHPLLDRGDRGDRHRPLPAADRGGSVHLLRHRRHHHRQGDARDDALRDDARPSGSCW